MTDVALSTRTDSPSVLRAQGLTKIFHSSNETVTVFEGVSFEVHRGELVALVGESGAGKSTLLHIMAALDTPSSGAVYFNLRPVGSFKADESAVYRSRELGFVWQMHYLLPEFTAEENIILPQLIAGTDFAAARARAQELLAEVGLERAGDRRAGELSGGEQQRVALARALANGPTVLLADEPTGNLDHQTAGRVVDLLERLHRTHGLTSVLATHNLELAGRADRVLRLENGKLTGSVSDASVKPASGAQPLLH